MEAVEQKLLYQIRNNFGFIGGLSLVFGLTSTLLFYKAGIGLNSFLFTMTMVLILIIISKKLGLSLSKITVFCFLGSIFLGLSNALTASCSLQFLNSIGILLLLELSLIQIFSTGKSLSFLEEINRLIKLPFKALSSIGMLFMDGNRFVKERKLIKNDRLRNVLIGCAIAIPFIIIIICLLSSADILFKRITESIFRWIIYPDFYTIIFLIILGTLLCYSLLCGACKENKDLSHEKAKVNSTIGITVSTLLLLVYIIFCGIQLLYLFSGGLFQLPMEFTYAEYARRGFFELLTVTSINIFFILICLNIFAESKLLKAILVAITACTYIMIASATYRMLLYIGAYHLTFLRLLVLLFLLIDAFLLAGVIIFIYNDAFPLLGYSVIIITSFYLVFSFSRPDYHMANYYIANNDKIEYENLLFLTEDLSYDASPVVAPLLEEQGDYNIEDIITRYYNTALNNMNSRDIRDFNFSHGRAIQLMKEHSSFKD